MAANDWSERTRMIVTAAVMLVINVGLGSGFYYVYGIWQEKDKIHKAKLADLKKLDDFLKQNESKPTELKILTEKFRLQQEKLPDSDQIAQLITDISKRAQSSNTHISTLVYKGPGGGDAGAQYVRETWGMRSAGDFMGWCKFLNEIEEQFPRFIAFEGLSLQPKNSGMVISGTEHEVSVDLVTYRYVKLPGQP